METTVPKTAAPTRIADKYKNYKFNFVKLLDELSKVRRAEIVKQLPDIMGMKDRTLWKKLYALKNSAQECNSFELAAFANLMTIELGRIVTIDELINRGE